MILRTVLGSIAFVGLLILNNCATAESTQAPHAASAPAASSLDGRSFEVALDIPGKAVETDALIFESGRFESTECTKYGFPRWTQYKSQRSANGIAFDVTTKNPSGATVEWKGVVRSDGKISGTAKVTMNGEVVNGSFEGTDTRQPPGPSVAAK